MRYFGRVVLYEMIQIMLNECPSLRLYIELATLIKSDLHNAQEIDFKPSLLGLTVSYL